MALMTFLSQPGAWNCSPPALGRCLIAPLPIDDISKRLAIEIGAQIGAEDIYGAMPILVSGARDMRRDQHPRIGPEPRHGRVLEFTDMDVERSAPYVIAAKRIDEGFLVDD